MHLRTLASFAVLPLLALAQDSSTTTLTSTATLTKTITVSEVVASVTSTIHANSSYTAIGTTSKYTSPVLSTAAPTSLIATSTPLPGNLGLGAASSLNSMYAGSVGLFVMVAAALL
ncbi:hypothetical protein B0O99DRAFT_692225 [Bisporella sp. PMI_857]|nr:hypothetical protein B0O99DRAFT_692225 [Bisporella sp. PMI_857]